MMIEDIWDVAPCSLVGETYVSDVYTASITGRCPSETSVYSNETTRRYIPEDFNHHIRIRENLKSQT
jgi:hypothetical protein